MTTSRDTTGLSRRSLLSGGVGAIGMALFGGTVAPVARASTGLDDVGPLGPPDANGLRLPPGFRSRIVARSGTRVADTAYTWHRAPDGGATFATDDGGWVYVSNSERFAPAGGVGALRFDRRARIVDAYSILSGTTRNCAGGPTPWGTWLSCEEVPAGRVYECDPLAPGSQGVVRPALGTFNHEAAAVDPVRECLYLTEDRRDGLLYRFTPDAWPGLGAGALEAMVVLDPDGRGPIGPGENRPVAWHPVANPAPAGGGVQSPLHPVVEERATRFQAPGAFPFDGGEGCWYADGSVFFATKGDHRVWRYDAEKDLLDIHYDLATTTTPVLSNVDNVFVTRAGDVLVAEDPGDLQIVAITSSHRIAPIVQVADHGGTEITGPALDPSGTRLYFSSQRNPGTTYEVEGPFTGPIAPAVPAIGGLGSSLMVGGLAAVASARLRSRRPRS